MATPGRGRGYSGRHHLREPRPGDVDSEEQDVVRTLAELSPRSTDLLKEMPKEPKMKEPSMIPPDIDNDDQAEKSVTCDDEAALAELLQVDEQYRPLINLLEQFTTGEDGIQFNRKLRQFETTVTNMCPDENRLIQVFSTFRGASLHSMALTRKLSAVGASFTRQQKQRALRCALLDVMQTTHAKLDVLERSNPIYLINAANLMGDYFAEARLCNGNKVHILASPLLQYMRALLASDDIRAHRSLATQLMQNGRELLSVLPQELDELSISIRLRLLTPPPVSTIWLILSADLCLNKFLPLPNTLQQFYASHLELSNDDNYSEVSYGSWKKTPEKDYSLDSSQEIQDKVSHNLSQVSINENGEVKPKLRPILGAGAGLLRQEQSLSISQENFENWTPKSLNKRYDLNSWRQQNEGEKSEETPVFNPSVLPPNMQNFNVPVPDYPPPNVTRYNYQETFPNYLQQGDGAFIQNQYVPNTNFSSQGDFVPQYQNEIPTPEKANSETQQSCNIESYSSSDFQTFAQETPITDKTNDQKTSKKPAESWRKEKSDVQEDANKNRPKNWTRQRSKDDLHADDEKFKNLRLSRDSLPGSNRSGNRLNRRDSSENEAPGAPRLAKTPPRRHVSDVPRNNRYWGHDDRCETDYNS